jgi:release factor glutamine methyltransferase
LIPRPETEELVDWIIKDVNASGKDVFKKAPTDADVTKQLKILDIGTGSGCIALALKNTMPKAEVWGCDVSEEALNVARRNGSDLNIRVDFQGIDFLDDAQQKFLPTVDIIVSNPPYIPLTEKGEMNPNVVNHEPHTALFVPDNDASLFYKAIAHFAKKRLYENGSIYLEIHENLGGEIVTLFEQEGYTTIALRKDMQGKNRMIKVVKVTK